MSIAVTGAGSPQLRLCNDASSVYACNNSETQAWTSGPVTLVAGTGLQLRATADAAAGQTSAVTLTADAVSADWQITTDTALYREDFESGSSATVSLVEVDTGSSGTACTDFPERQGVLAPAHDETFSANVTMGGDYLLYTTANCETIIDAIPLLGASSITITGDFAGVSLDQDSNGGEEAALDVRFDNGSWQEVLMVKNADPIGNVNLFENNFSITLPTGGASTVDLLLRLELDNGGADHAAIDNLVITP